MTNFSKLFTEVICNWPNGEARVAKVTHVNRKNNTVSIVWDEKLDTFSKEMSEEVPIRWLSEIN